MRVAVAGTHTPIGRRIREALLERGDEVREIGDDLQAGHEAAPPLAADGPAAPFDSTDAVLLTGLVEEPEDVGRVADRLEALIAAADLCRVRRLVVVGSSAVYSPGALAETTVSEDGPFVTRAEAGPLAQAAMRLELALASARHVGARVLLRAERPFGRDLPVARRMIADAWAAGAPAWPDARLQGVDADDLAAAAVRALDAAPAVDLAINVAGPVAVTSAAALAEIGRLGRILTDDTDATIRVRPEYPAVPPVIDPHRARLTLGERPRKRIWVSFAEILQTLIQEDRHAGRRPPVRTGLPPTLDAIHNGTRPLAGKRVLLTDGTGKVGRHVAPLLLQLGADLVIAVPPGPDAPLLPGAVEPPARLTTVPADLTRLRDVRRLAEKAAPDGRLDVLLNLASAMFEERALTEDGLERTFALNAMAPFLLTDRLAATLAAAPEARVINVVNDIYSDCPVDLHDLQGEIAFSPMPSFGRAHAARVTLSGLLAETATGTPVRVLTMTTGPVSGETWRLPPVPRNDPVIGPQEQQRLQGIRDRMEGQMISSRVAAEHVVDCVLATGEQARNGAFITREGPRPVAGHILHRETALCLWQLCADLARRAERSPAMQAATP